jgi:vacuolar-type H+-ATPase subunit H
MASRKEERKDETAAMRQENQEAVSKTLDEAKDNTRKMMDEARRDISARTATFNDYQEQTIKAART